MPAVSLTTHAENDLLDAWMHIAQDNPDAADKLVASLLAAAHAEQWRCHRPHPGKEAKRYQVEEARELLERAGVTP